MYLRSWVLDLVQKLNFLSERLLLAQGQGFDHPFAMGSNYLWFTFDGGKDTFNGKNKEELFGQNYGDMEAKRDNLYNI